MAHSDALGEKPIGRLLFEQAVPASIGFLIMSIYGIVDTIFVGHWVGALGIGAITVVMPITFLISSVGMAIGIGGASVISRALGSKNRPHALHTFGNQVSMTLIIAVSIVVAGAFFQEEILTLFGGKGNILPFAKTYFQILLLGIPFLAFAMMFNNDIRAVGAPKVAMMILVIPAVANIILDPIFIVALDMGIAGAAWATTLSYVASAGFGLWYFLSGRSELSLTLERMILKWEIVSEIFSIGFVTLARQGTISLLAIVLNNVLFSYGGEMGLSIYGIINRMMMFANFPVLGITQGFLPIAGYNYGAEKWARVREVIVKAISYGTGIAVLIFTGLYLFAEPLVSLFTTDEQLLEQTPSALITVFRATPLLAIQLIGSAYFQAIGKVMPALLLTLLKQGFFLIPLVLILPVYFGLDGIWWSFPIADILTAIVNFFFIRKAHRTLGNSLNGLAIGR